MVRGIAIIVLSIIHFTIGHLAFSQGTHSPQSHSRSLGKNQKAVRSGTIQGQPMPREARRAIGNCFDRSL